MLNSHLLSILTSFRSGVLGTTFNVDAYPGNAAITVALVEGKILLQHTCKDKVSDLMEMKPNQVAFFKPSENKIQWKTESDLTKYTAWTDGKIVFPMTRSLQ